MYGDYKYKQHMWTLYIRTSYHFFIYIYIYVYKSHIWSVHIKAIWSLCVRAMYCHYIYIYKEHIWSLYIMTIYGRCMYIKTIYGPFI